MSDFNRMNTSTRAVDQAYIDEGLRAHMLRIYNYMSAALALTGIVAWVWSIVWHLCIFSKHTFDICHNASATWSCPLFCFANKQYDCFQGSIGFLDICWTYGSFFILYISCLYWNGYIPNLFYHRWCFCRIKYMGLYNQKRSFSHGDIF